MSYSFNFIPSVKIQRKAKAVNQKSPEEIALENEQFLSFLLSQKLEKTYFSNEVDLVLEIAAANIQNKMDNSDGIFQKNVSVENFEIAKVFGEKDEPLIESLNIKNLSLNPAERETILDKRKKKK